MATRYIPTTPKKSGSSTSRPKTQSSSSSSKSKAKTTDPNKAALAANKAAENRAVARENAAKKKAGRKYMTQASNLQYQANALKTALAKSFASNRDQNLRDISKNLNEQIGILKGGAALKAKDLYGARDDNTKAQAGQLNSSFGNLVRERQDAMTSILEHGAGETDTMRAMLTSARNMQANAQEANRSYFDTNRSIQSTMTDLNVDARTALSNIYGSAESERDRIWQDFYTKRGDAYTQLGNVKGQQADYYASAQEMGVNPGKGKVKSARTAMKNAYNSATDQAGRSYVQKALPASAKNYTAGTIADGKQSNTNLASAITIDKAEKAEGSSLRRWEG